MSTIIILALFVLLVVAVFKAVSYRAERDETRATLADYVAACDDWSIAYDAVMRDLAKAQNHAYDLNYTLGNGHKDELPLIIGESDSKVVIVESEPRLVIKEFKNRKGETITIDEPEPATDDKSDDDSGSDEIVKELETRLGTLSDKEREKIAKWESGKGKGNADEYEKRIKGMRK